MSNNGFIEIEDHMTLSILGIGTALPSCWFTQTEAIRHAQSYCCENSAQERALAGVYRRTNIRMRGSSVMADANTHSHASSFYPLPAGPLDAGPTTGERMKQFAPTVLPLAVSAARAALADAGVSASSITHIVTVSCTGFRSPGMDHGLLEELPLSRSVRRCNVGFMGCHGALNALDVASAWAARQPDAKILLCAAELCTLHFQYGWNGDNVLANSLFADGAAALVAVGRAESPRHAWRLVASGSFVVPDTQDAMTWQIGDNGFIMTLSALVPDLIEAHLYNMLARWLRDFGLRVSDITNWIVHPGGPRILDAVSASLDLPDSALSDSREVLAEYGNMCSPTVLFILERMLRRQAQGPCVMLAFGPGLTIEAALLN